MAVYDASSRKHRDGDAGIRQQVGGVLEGTSRRAYNCDHFGPHALARLQDPQVNSVWDTLRFVTSFRTFGAIAFLCIYCASTLETVVMLRVLVAVKRVAMSP